MRASCLLIAFVLLIAFAQCSQAIEKDSTQVDPDRRGDVLATDPEGTKKEDVDTQQDFHADSTAKEEEGETARIASDEADGDEEAAAAGIAEEAADDEDEQEEESSPSLIEQNAKAQTQTEAQASAQTAAQTQSQAESSIARKPANPKAKAAKAPHSKAAKPTAALKHRFTATRRRRRADGEDADESAQSPSWILPLAPAGYGGPGVINPYSNVNPLNPMAAQMQAEAGGNGAGGPPQAQMGPAQNNNAGVTPSSFIEVGQIKQNTTSTEAPATLPPTSAPSSSPSSTPSVAAADVWTVTADTPAEPAQQPAPVSLQEQQAQLEQQAQQAEQEQQQQSKPKHKKTSKKGLGDSLSFDRAFMKNIESVFDDVLRDAHEKRAAQFNDESSHLLDLTRMDSEPHVEAQPKNKAQFADKVEQAISEALAAASTPSKGFPLLSSSAAAATAALSPSSPSAMLLRDKDITTTPDSAPIDADPLPSNMQPALPPIVSDITEIREAMDADGKRDEPLAIVVKSPLRSFFRPQSAGFIPSAARVKTQRGRFRRLDQQVPSARQLQALFKPMSAAALMPLPFIPFLPSNMKLMFSPSAAQFMSSSSPFMSSPSSSDFSWPVVHNSVRISEEKDGAGRLIGLRNFNHQDTEEDDANDKSQLQAATAEFAKDMTQLVRQLVSPKDEANELAKPARLEVVQMMPVAGGMLIRDEKIQEVGGDDDDDDNDYKLEPRIKIRMESPNPLGLLGASLAAGGVAPFPAMVELGECRGCEFASQELDDVALPSALN